MLFFFNEILYIALMKVDKDVIRREANAVYHMNSYSVCVDMRTGKPFVSAVVNSILPVTGDLVWIGRTMFYVYAWQVVMGAKIYFLYPL